VLRISFLILNVEFAVLLCHNTGDMEPSFYKFACFLWKKMLQVLRTDLRILAWLAKARGKKKRTTPIECEFINNYVKQNHIISIYPKTIKVYWFPFDLFFPKLNQLMLSQVPIDQCHVSQGSSLLTIKPSVFLQLHADYWFHIHSNL
jgi:hypothetical protein